MDAIYPSGATVPENLLRFYIYFTTPIAGDDVLEHLQLTRSDGSLVDGAFLSNRFDLWSPDRTRLTLLFNPGRVKTGLKAHEELGRALETGQQYTLTIGRALKDTKGCMLATMYGHQFTVGASDLNPPDPASWEIEPPAANSLDPLTIKLDTPHDHLSMAFQIRVIDALRKAVPGRLTLLGEETVWQFKPATAWETGTYRISINEAFEDLAGNRPGQLFDQPMTLDMPNPTLERTFQTIR